MLRTRRFYHFAETLANEVVNCRSAGQVTCRSSIRPPAVALLAGSTDARQSMILEVPGLCRGRMAAVFRPVTLGRSKRARQTGGENG